MRRLFIVVLAIVCVLCGCTQKKYELSQTAANIETIEIIYASTYETVSLKKLQTIEPVAIIPLDMFSLFLEELLRLPNYSLFMDPPESIAGYAVRIGYCNGAIEWICSVSGLYSDAEQTKWKHMGFENDVFNTFLQKWINSN